MRNEICKSMIALAKDTNLVFLTGDLGFMALEPLRKELKCRFINAGLAEQNMVSAAAGLALTGLQAWVYSIAPFCYARPFEQIRNDVCLNKFPVKLIGNGGGYAYGSMGGTHHALEDYGVLLGLQNMQVFVPAFTVDIDPIVRKMSASPYPNYLRLGRCELPKDFLLPKYQAWRCLLKGNGPLLVCMGPLVGSLINFFHAMNISERPEIWVVAELPLTMESIPKAFLQKLAQVSVLGIAEEHVAQGGFGQNLVWELVKCRIYLPKLCHAYARGYPSGTYGSQQFHRIECGLDPQSIMKMLDIKKSFNVSV